MKIQGQYLRGMEHGYHFPSLPPVKYRAVPEAVRKRFRERPHPEVLSAKCYPSADGNLMQTYRLADGCRVRGPYRASRDRKAPFAYAVQGAGPNGVWDDGWAGSLREAVALSWALLVMGR